MGTLQLHPQPHEMVPSSSTGNATVDEVFSPFCTFLCLFLLCVTLQRGRGPEVCSAPGACRLIVSVQRGTVGGCCNSSMCWDHHDSQSLGLHSERLQSGYNRGVVNNIHCWIVREL